MIKKFWDKNQVNWSYTHGQPVWFVEVQKLIFLTVLGAIIYFALK